MTTGTVKTQGTHIFFIETTVSTDPTLYKMACPTGASGLGGAADQIESTCLDALVDREYVKGLGNPGQVTIPFNFLTTGEFAPSHQLLFDLKDGGKTMPWMICLSEGTAAPTMEIDTDADAVGTFVAPAGRTSLGFDAYISDINIDIATNEIVRGTLTLQRSGVVTPYWNA